MTKILVWVACAVMTAAGGTTNSGEWVERDIGDCKLKGSMLFDQEASRWILRGNGDIWLNADSFHYVYRPLRGDGSITARVESVSNTHNFAKAGVMIREDLEPGSKQAFVDIHSNAAVALQSRVATAAATTSREGPVVRAPYWVKLTRSGNKFTARRSVDGVVWVPIAGDETLSSIEIEMARDVYVGLAVSSYDGSNLCEARFDHVRIVHGWEITDAEVRADPNRAVHKAYQNLSQLGNWLNDAAVRKENENLIAQSLTVILKVSEARKAAEPEVLAGYYRIVELVPDAPLTVNALSRIAILDRDKGLPFATKQLERKSQADRDAFYLALIRDGLEGAMAQENTLPIKWFVEYAGTRSDMTLLEDALRLMDGTTNETALRKGLIQSGMAQPATERIAIATLRSVAVKADNEKKTAQVLETAKWAAGQFPDSKLSVCAKTVLADAEYGKGRYVEALQEFQPGFLTTGQPEPKVLEAVERVVPLYRAGTLRSDGVVDDSLYRAIAGRADELGWSSVVAHCYKKLADAKGLSMGAFTKSAQAGTKYSGGTPENEVWFWKGCLAALDGDPMMAVRAYERFLKQDDKSILAAKAYCDLARIKMAMGEDPRQWVAKAKAISLCQEVTQLELELNPSQPR